MPGNKLPVAINFLKYHLWLLQVLKFLTQPRQTKHPWATHADRTDRKYCVTVNMTSDWPQAAACGQQRCLRPEQVPWRLPRWGRPLCHTWGQRQGRVWVGQAAPRSTISRFASRRRPGKKVYFYRKPIVRGSFTQGLSSLKRWARLVCWRIFWAKMLLLVQRGVLFGLHWVYMKQR
jgi:hypothetical protein